MLQKGDIIRIICTARSVQKETLLPAIRLLKSWGYVPQLGNTIGKVHHQYGGTNKERLADLIDAIKDPEVKAIWIARGGYGTIHLLQDEFYEAFAKADHPTLLIGYSDVTLLHAIWNNRGWPSLHAFMPLELKHKTQESIQSLKNVLAGKSNQITIPNNQNLTPQRIKSELCGGNLSILYSLLGSRDQLKTNNKVLFIEEIDEYIYHVERMLYSLKRAGLLTNLKALLIGGMTDFKDHNIPLGKTYQQIILDLTAEYDYPVIFDVPAGHVKDHRTLSFGSEVEIKILEESIEINS